LKRKSNHKNQNQDLTLNPTLRCVPSYLTAPDKKSRILTPLAEKNQFFNTFPVECWKTTTTKTKILPKAEKIIFQYLSNLNLTRKKQPPNQDLAKSWKNPVFNTFQIKKWTEKSSHQNQDLAKCWKRHFSILFLNKNWIEKSNHQSCQKLKQTFFQYFSNKKIEEKKQPQKPKPRSYFKSNTPVCAILSDRTGQEMQDPEPTW